MKQMKLLANYIMHHVRNVKTRHVQYVHTCHNVHEADVDEIDTNAPKYTYIHVYVHKVYKYI